MEQTPRAKDERASRQLGPRQLILADDPEGEQRRNNGDDQRHQRNRRVVAHRDGHTKRQHADEVHGPDADAHRDGSAGQPPGGGPATRGRNTPGQVQSRVRRQRRHQQREHDQTGIVAAGHRAVSLRRDFHFLNVQGPGKAVGTFYPQSLAAAPCLRLPDSLLAAGRVTAALHTFPSHFCGITT
jgi:hypothetical protein